MLEIEIAESNIIDGGIEVFARAWQDGVQIGFGADGSVDIERFRVFNPPVLVRDESGTIIHETRQYDPVFETDYVHIARYREDPEEALLQVLEHNIKVIKISGPNNIVPGKRGNTTTTVYPDASPGSTTQDLTCYGNGSTFAAVWSDTTANGGGNTSANDLAASLDNVGGSNRFMRRSMLLFDTSAVGSDTISSATFSLYATSLTDNTTDTQSAFCVVSANPTSNTVYTASTDYDKANYGTTKYATVLGDNITTSAYNDWSLDSNGIANINGSGVSKFGFRLECDVDGVEWPGTPVSNILVRLATDMANQTGTASDPKLVIEHSAATPSTFTPKVMMF